MLVIHRLFGRRARPEDGGWPLPTAGGQRRTDTACCVHRPTKPVFCSRVRRQREASICWDGWLEINRPACMLLFGLWRVRLARSGVEGGGPTGTVAAVIRFPIAPALQSPQV